MSIKNEGSPEWFDPSGETPNIEVGTARNRVLRELHTARSSAPSLKVASEFIRTARHFRREAARRDSENTAQSQQE